MHNHHHYMTTMMDRIRVPKVNRFNAWMALAIFSAVSLQALAGYENKSSKTKYSIACCAMSIVFSIAVLVVHFIKSASERYVGTQYEGALASVILVLWTAGIAVIQNPDNGLATGENDKKEVISNANLYFSSWICFVATVFIAGSVAQQLKLGDIESVMTMSTPKTIKWYMLVASSMVVLCCAADLRRRACTNDCQNSQYGNNFCVEKIICSRTNFAISLGVFNSIVAFGAVLMERFNLLTFIAEAIAAMFAFVFYIFGVLYITDTNGPGAGLGNLYFSTWVGFVSSLMLVSACIKEFIAAKNATEADGVNRDVSDEQYQDENTQRMPKHVIQDEDEDLEMVQNIDHRPEPDIAL